MTPPKGLSQALLLLCFAGSTSATTVTLLTDGFEGYPIVPPDGPDLPTGLPTPTAFLTPLAPPSTISNPSVGVAGDPSRIVGTSDTVSPHGGSQMVQFVHTNVSPPTAGSNGDLYYVLDLSTFATSLAAGGASVNLSAWFNTGPSGNDTQYFLGLGAYGDMADLPGDISTIDDTDADRLARYNNFDPASDRFTVTPGGGWAEGSITLDLPEETRFLTVRLAAHETGAATDPDFTSSYADDLQLDLVLPNGFIANPVTPDSVPASGSTIVFLFTALAGLSLAGPRRKNKKA